MRKVDILIVFLLCFLMGCQPQKIAEKDYDYILFATPLRQHPIWLQAKEGKTR